VSSADTKGTARRPLRSHAWFAGRDKTGFLHRSWLRNQGLPDDSFDGRPVIGICNTASDLVPCNNHFRQVVEKVKHGVLQAGGLPLEFSVTPLGEPLLRPSAMMFRNLASMDVEETLRANPIDGVVLLTGCDKTTPALLMGAASCNLPTIVLPGGPMLNGKYRGQDIGSGTVIWRFAEEVKAGRMSTDDFMEAEACMSRSAGHCMTMGTASTMASIVEALGMCLPQGAATPAPDARRSLLAQLSGRRIVEMVHEDLKIGDVMTRAAFENAIAVTAAIGGSTNAVIHLVAMARRLGIALTVDDWDRVGRAVPTLVNLMPAGRFLMEDFFYAGGVPVVLKRLLEAGMLHGDCATVMGQRIGDMLGSAICYDDDVIRPLDRPLTASGGIAVLRGNLAPDGAVLKPAAASPHLMRHQGRAVVFEDYEHYKQRIDDPDLAVEEDSVLVLKNAGPKGYPGMPEIGNFGLPPKLLKAGVKDMVRISDARMSGTAYGTIVLHVCPEAAAGGPLAVVKDGDMILLDVEQRRLELMIDDAELQRRLTAWRPSKAHAASGYERLYVEHVTQASDGADFDFLEGQRGAAVPLESH
jgi:L-arabonate dehydrase